jgi:uncharacterized Tic20 family protein
MLAQPQSDLPQHAGVMPTADEKNMGMLAHLTALLGTLMGGGLLGFVGPLVLYTTQREKSAFITFHARESLNHQITFLIFYLFCGCAIFVGSFFCIGFLFFFPLGIAALLSLIFEIMACVQASRGEWTRIPWSIRFLS